MVGRARHDRDDEVNLSVRGGNYGWDPVPGYDETTPMTDLGKFPTARLALWSSGFPTVATSGATFLRDSRWGEWQGALAVGLLKGQGIYLMRMNPSPTTTRPATVTRMAIAQGYGRIRAVQLGRTGRCGSRPRTAPTTTSSASPREPRCRDGPAAASSRPSASPPRAPGRRSRPSSAAPATPSRSSAAPTTGPRGVPGSRPAVTSTDAPSATSSRSGRVDLFTRNSARQLVHTWYQDGIRKGSANLGGTVVAQHGASLGNGTLDVFAVATTGSAWRKHFDGTRWSGWISAGGVFTSGLSASANPASGGILVTGRGTNGATYERTFYPTTATSSWVQRGDSLAAWSDRALGDAWPGRALVAVGNGVDGRAVVQRGSLLVGTPQAFTSAPDVVTRADGTFLLFGRGSGGELRVYDGRVGAFTSTSLGGIVR